MNKQECDILNTLLSVKSKSQRLLSEKSGYSLGVVNRSLKSMVHEGFLTEEMEVTNKAKEYIGTSKPKNAIILAAGYGMRMVPINRESSKGLLEIKGEPLIERLIKQLHDVGINEIYIVVGFMKEQYEYLIDTYGVELIVNSEYSSKNNIHSLKCAINHLTNSYIIPCDIWCESNPFNKQELYSWYMVTDELTTNGEVRINRKEELVKIPETGVGNKMIGVSYLVEKDAKIVRDRLQELCADAKNNDAFWEETLYQKDKMIIAPRVVSANDVIEINTYEQLRELDSNSKQLQIEAMSVLTSSLKVKNEDVKNITVLKIKL